MLDLTKAAQDKLASVLQSNPDCNCVRIGVAGGGCSGFEYKIALGPDIKWPIDYEQQWNLYGSPTLKVFVDPMSDIYLDGVTVDYIESLTESGFRFNNPNVKSQCGCGKSFSA